MKAHPIIESPFRWIPMLVLALILVAFQVALVCGYTGNDYLPALVDGIVTIGWLAAIAYLAWFVVGLVSLFQTDVIMIIVGSLLWLAGSVLCSFCADNPFPVIVRTTGFNCYYSMVPLDSHKRRSTKSGTGKRTGCTSGECG